MEMEREYEDWMNGIQNSKLYLRLYNIKSSVFVTVKSPVFVNVKPVPFNIVGGFYNVTSQGHDIMYSP